MDDDIEFEMVEKLLDDEKKVANIDSYGKKSYDYHNDDKLESSKQIRDNIKGKNGKYDKQSSMSQNKTQNIDNDYISSECSTRDKNEKVDKYRDRKLRSREKEKDDERHHKHTSSNTPDKSQSSNRSISDKQDLGRHRDNKNDRYNNFRNRSNEKDVRNTDILKLQIMDNKIDNNKIDNLDTIEKTTKRELPSLEIYKAPKTNEVVMPELHQPIAEDALKRKELEDARRDNLTVLVINLNLRCLEREIYLFFAEYAGKVRDIQIVRDSKSGKPKGVAYVEFYEQESVIKALGLTGQSINGQQIRVQSSQADKNRVPKSTKVNPEENANIPLRIYVGNLCDELSLITESELHEMFSIFGEVVEINIPKDPYSAKGRGFAYILFRRAVEGKEALTAMNGFNIYGKELRVGFVTEKATLPSNYISDPSMQYRIQSRQGFGLDSEFDDGNNREIDDGHDTSMYLHGASSRQALMKKLLREDPVDLNCLQDTVIPVIPTSQNNMSTVYNSQYLVLKNMFSKQEVDLNSDSRFFDEISEDVNFELTKYGRVLNLFINRYYTLI